MPHIIACQRMIKITLWKKFFSLEQVNCCT